MSKTRHAHGCRPIARSIATILVVVTAASSCSHGGGSTATTATEITVGGESTVSVEPRATTSEPPATQPPESGMNPDQEAVIGAYLGFWNARNAANTGTPNPQDPALAEFATGGQLEWVIAETQRHLDEGVALRAAPNPANYHRIMGVAVDGETATVQACVVDDWLMVDRATGQVLNDAVSTQSAKGTLHFVEGAWRVAGTELLQKWEGVAGCALAS